VLPRHPHLQLFKVKNMWAESPQEAGLSPDEHAVAYKDIKLVFLYTNAAGQSEFVEVQLIQTWVEAFKKAEHKT